MNSTLRTILVGAIAVVGPIQAASIRVEWSNAPGTELLTRDRDPLSAGTILPGDGAILELGFHTLGTPTSPFSGEWQPMTGPNTGYLGTSIGGKATTLPGTFDWSNTIGDNVGSRIQPSLGTPLVIRFYDNVSLNTATYFNAVSNSTGSWNWLTPTDPQTVLNLSLSDSGLVWQDGPASAFRTTIPIPEPSLLLLIAAGAFLPLRRHRV